MPIIIKNLARDSGLKHNVNLIEYAINIDINNKNTLKYIVVSGELNMNKKIKIKIREVNKLGMALYLNLMEFPFSGRCSIQAR